MLFHLETSPGILYAFLLNTLTAPKNTTHFFSGSQHFAVSPSDALGGRQD